MYCFDIVNMSDGRIFQSLEFADLRASIPMVREAVLPRGYQAVVHDADGNFIAAKLPPQSDVAGQGPDQ